MYWVNLQDNAIGRASLAGSGANPSFISFPPPYIPVYPLGVAVDSSHIYWTNYGNGAVRNTTIGRANLDGTGVDVSFITGATAPAGIAVDGSHIYWTNISSSDPSSDSIGRANLDGTGVNQSFVSTPGGANAVAVGGSYIYWTNANAIGRANLDGTGVNQSFIAGPQALSLAVDGQHIYWGNDNTTIGRANLDGTGVTASFIKPEGPPEGLALDGQHIYWSNDDNTIGRASLDGSGVNNSFVTGAGQAFGVAVDGGGSKCNIPARGASPVDCGAAPLDTGPVTDVTWGQSCSMDVGCFPVAFNYTIRGSAGGELFSVGQPPWAFLHVTSLAASLVISQGQSNGWGIEVVPGVSPTLNDNWQRLPCVNGGAPRTINVGAIPTVPTASDPSDSVIARNAPVNTSLYDPAVTLAALAVAKEYDVETGSNFFPLPTIPAVGFVSPGCSASAPFARLGSLRRRMAAGAGRIVSSQIRLGRGGALGSVYLARLRIPRVRVDGHMLSSSALMRTSRALAAQNHRLGRLALVREAVATAVLDVLLNERAARTRPVAQRLLTAAISGLVRAYDRDPRAARRAGVHIPPGESARRYFSSPRRLKGYRALLTLGSVRKSIVMGARTDPQRRRRYARWLTQALRHHRVRILGMPRFSLPAALPDGVS